MEPIELTISDGEETYVLTAIRGTPECWEVGPFKQVIGGRAFADWSIALDPLANRVYPTPYACLEALFRAVVTELFGVKA